MERDIMDDLFEELVPSMGKSDTVAGELLRATARIRYRFFNDGDKALSGYGNETCNGSLRYITGKLVDLEGTDELIEDFNMLWDGDSMFDDEYEEQLEICVAKMIEFIDENEDLKLVANEDDSTSDFNEKSDFDYDYEDEDDYDYYEEDDYDYEY